MKLLINDKYFVIHNRGTNSIHEPVLVTYQAFTISGKKYLQFDSYTQNTKFSEVESGKQSNHKMQFDKETAEEFIKFLQKEFNLT